MAGVNGAPPPTYHTAIQGSRFGFRFNGQDSGAPLGSAVPPSRISTALSSRKASIAPTPHGGAAAYLSHGGAIPPSSRRGSIPSSRRGSIPSSRRGSMPPSSHGGSVVPTSRQGSVIPSSRGASAAPNSRGGSVVNSRSTSTGTVSGSWNRTSDARSSQYDVFGVPSLPMDSTWQPISPDPPPSGSHQPSFNYGSDAESQIPNDYLWQRARVDGNGGVWIEGTQCEQTGGDLVSFHSNSFHTPSLLVIRLCRVRRSMKYLPMKTIGRLRAWFETTGTKVSIWTFFTTHAYLIPSYRISEAHLQFPPLQ